VNSVQFEQVGKHFYRCGVQNQYSTLKAILSRSRRPGGKPFLALEDVSFSVTAGETFALIGSNGAGKSTVLKLAAGIYQPDRGSVVVDGRVGSLIELGLGFHPDFSGRENIIISGLLHGMTRHEVKTRFDDIVGFANVGDFIDEPVRTYSSGMYMRLGFSIAIHCAPEILLIDEVLAVGDATFQRRCVDRLVHLRANGTTILMATHQIDMVRAVCARALWLEKGRARALGDAREVSDAYERSVAQAEQADGTAESSARDGDHAGPQ